MANLRREPSAFFTFLLFSFFTTLALSMVFRTVGASSRSLVQALCPSSIFTLALMTYTGFVVPTHDMHPWFRWIGYIDPIAYAFESLMINEFSGRIFPCATFVPSGPGYLDVAPLSYACAVVGSEPGSHFVLGDHYIMLGFDYYPGRLWRFVKTFICRLKFLEKKS